jgi:hypothetical protein
MPITNSNSYGSISKWIPAKVIPGNINTITPLESWLYNDGLGDPWWVGVNGNPCKWIITADVYSQSHSSHETRTPFYYTGSDISPGMWICTPSVNNAALRINSISSVSDTSITFIAEDVDRYNTFNDPNSSGIGGLSTGSALFFELGDDGLPVFNNLNSSYAVDPLMIAQIEARFRVFNPSVQVPCFQLNHNFTEGMVLTLDSSTGLFRNSTSTDIFRVGTVVATGPGPNYFYLEPITKIISNLEPGLIGTVGDIVWIDPTTGAMSTTEGSSLDAIYIKMTEAQPSFTVSQVENPTAYNGWQFLLNEVILTVNGTYADPQPTSYLIDLINSTTNQHSVTAAMGSQPTIVVGSIQFPETAVNGDSMQFSINGVTITVTSPSLMINLLSGSTVGWWDFVRPINELTSQHGVYATSDPNTSAITLTNASGGPINIVNISPSTSDASAGFLTFTDACGFELNNASGPANYLQLLRADGGQIIISDNNVENGTTNQLGMFVANSIIPSVANGQLPLAIVVDQSMYANTNYVVPNIAARNALTNMRVGDQAYVQADTNGEWSMYLYTASGWVETANQASASTDANSLQIEITPSSPVSQSIGVVSLDSTIISVMVQVTAPFTADAVLTVGTSSVVDAIMPASNIDLTTIGNYEIDPSFVYGSSASDFNVDVYFTVGSATTGSATVIVSYL